VETGIGLAASAVATLRPLLRQVFGDLSTNGNSDRKNSRIFNGTYPSRSGYEPHPSKVDNNEIPLTGHDQEFSRVHVVSGGGSPTGSTFGLKDWEDEKKSENLSPCESAANNKGILKTVKITQL
jgi:hypothetical protein